MHVSGRDDDDASYRLVIWQAPAAPEVVHKQTDRLGHRLRGEPEPPLVIPPDAEHRWTEVGDVSSRPAAMLHTGNHRPASFGGAEPTWPCSAGTNLARWT